MNTKANRRNMLLLFLSIALDMGGLCQASETATPDQRNITAGTTIPSEGYADQPYIITTDDHAWLCVMTTGKGAEGEHGQHVISMRSTDQGKTWSAPLDVEPANGPEASYAVMLKVPGGRIYCFYNHNTDLVSEVKREDNGTFKRVDSLGHYVFRFTDDHGLTWSEKRYDIPVREFECDRNNAYQGKLQLFWNVGRPLILNGAAICVLHKVGAMGKGFFAQSEGAVLRSANMLTERDPAKITFDTLPDGDIGLRTPTGGGRVSEEQSISALSDGSLYCVYRTIDGWPTSTYSRDGGHTWTSPAYATYTPGGRRIKHPRAANFAWRCSNGKFLYWFHNHGGPFIGEMGAEGKRGNSPYENRNPAWIAAGRECDSVQGKVIQWSQPEILLYHDDPLIRISYPDLVEDNGKFFVTETQKTIGRVHEISGSLVDGLFNQWDNHTVASNGLVLSLDGTKPLPLEIPMPALPPFRQHDGTRLDGGSRDTCAGFTIDMKLKFKTLTAGQVLLDSRTAAGQGLLVSTTENGTIKLTINDGRSESSWDCDEDVLQPGRDHHVTVIVDGGPKIITFIVDGILCDGGDKRQFGWGRFDAHLREANGAQTLRIAPKMDGAISLLRIYKRALRTSEAVGNFQVIAAH